MIEVEEFSYCYPNGMEVLKDINLKIPKSAIVLITGPTGCGKTSLCRAIQGTIPQFYGGKMKGSVKINGLDTRQTPLATLTAQVGMVFQEPTFQIVGGTIEQDIAFGLENLNIPSIEIKERINHVLDRFNIESFRKRTPESLSGGEKAIAALASVAVMQPKVLILDEVTTQLDFQNTQRVLKLASELHDSGITILMISHRLEHLLPLADSLLVMQNGQVYFFGDVKEGIKDSKVNDIILAPPVVQLFQQLRAMGISVSEMPLNPKQASEILKALL
ncbi:MAG: energy-coupling factor ABC transporter ATP-binding protein [Promethearchaeota archaeon]